MDNITLHSVPFDSRFYCLSNYNAFTSVKDKDGKSHYIDLPRLDPIYAPTLEQAKTKLAEMLGINESILGEWDVIGDEDGFSPSICIGYTVGPHCAGYSFDVYVTVNTLALV